MRVTVDEETDMAYIYLDYSHSVATEHTIEFDHPDVQGSIYLDFDSSWRLHGLEVFRPSRVLAAAVLQSATPTRVNSTQWESFGSTQRIFMEACLTHYSFLRDDYGFALSGKSESPVSAEIRFANNTTGVIIGWDEPGHSLDAFISREDGTPMKWRHVNDLIRISEPAWSPTKGGIATVWSEDDIVESVAAYAGALRRCGDATLRGDFTAINEPPAR